MSEGSDSTTFLTTYNAERYNTRPSTAIQRSATIDDHNHHHHRASRYSSLVSQEDINRNHFSAPLSRSADRHLTSRSSKTKRSVEWDEENLQANEGKNISIYNTK